MWHLHPLERITDRRGIAGDLFVIKIAGAAAAQGHTLDEVYRIASKARDNTRTMGVAALAGTFPETGKPTFELPDDEIEIGMGLHGEPGVYRTKMVPTDQIVDLMMSKILLDLPFQAGDKVCVLVNDLGATTMAELLIVYRRVHQILVEHSFDVHDVVIGSYCTCQEMTGFSITLLKVDEELMKYYDMPASSIGYVQR